MTTRPASHAGSWYSQSAATLSGELDDWLAQVPAAIEGVDLPVSGARIIIAPHAGYSYSGPAAAWAYKSLDLSKAKRVFLLGPSHALYLSGCAISGHAKYATPLGDLSLDRDTIQELKATHEFEDWSASAESKEHSLEMHLPYIHKMFSKAFSSPAQYPSLVPILVGNTDAAAEKKYGAILAPYLADSSSIFIVSSDFCHWGLRFDYTYYLSGSSNQGSRLSRRAAAPTSPTIHESITQLDKRSMDAIEGGKHDSFLAELKQTGNTVCGRHPIGVVMAAVEVLQSETKTDVSAEKGRFKFVRYERSSDPEDINDSSVSYASAYATL